jgi:TonB family protein
MKIQNYCIFGIVLCLSYLGITPVIAQDKKPIPISMETPEYPSSLRLERISGVVIIEFVIGKDGTVTSAVAVKSPDIRLSELAIAAVLKWKFEPGLKDGVLLDVRCKIPVIFDLKSKPKSSRTRQ